jgi:16S rRNA (cytosine1402-N4)-methyltransferase
MADNPRARSAKLRVAERTAAPAGAVDPAALGVPALHRKGRR